jgi:hypothetical protein
VAERCPEQHHGKMIFLPKSCFFKELICQPCVSPMLRCNPASSAFRRIRLVGPTAGVLTEEVLGLGFGLGSTDDVLDFRLKNK